MIHNDATPVIEVDPETYEVQGGRCGADLRAGDGAADGAKVFPVLGWCYGRARRQLGLMRKRESHGDFTRAQAEKPMDAFYEAVVESVATKYDFAEGSARCGTPPQ